MGVEHTPPPSTSAPGPAGPSSSVKTGPKGTPGRKPSAEAVNRAKINNIIVPSLNHKELVKIVESLGLELKLRRGARGSTVLVDSLEAQEAVLNKLKVLKVNCFTTGGSESSTDKFLLYGLCDFSESELADELKARDLPAVMIKKFNNKQGSNRETFLVCFRTSAKITLESVRRVKTLFNTLVNWKKFEERQTKVNQCFNCLQFGHSSYVCKSSPVCVLCGKDHNKSHCPIPKLENGKVDDKFLRCALCNGQHTASFSACPSRIDYICSQEIKQSKPDSHPKTSEVPIVERPLLACAWPQLSETVPLRSGPAPSAVSNLKETPPSQLFSYEELWRIFLDFSTRLAACKSKNEQIESVAELAIRYIVPRQQTRESTNFSHQNKRNLINKSSLTSQTSTQPETSSTEKTSTNSQISPKNNQPNEKCDLNSNVELPENPRRSISFPAPHCSTVDFEGDSLSSESPAGTPIREGVASVDVDPGGEFTRVLRSAKSGPR